MSERLHESLSALMDGEAEELELRRILAEQDATVVDAKWQRYHIARDAMQAHQTLLTVDISQRVSAAIAAEDGHTESVESKSAEKAESSKLAWLRPVSGFAVAASVAAAVVIGVRTLDVQSPVNLPQGLSSTPQLASSRAYPVTGGSVAVGSVAASSSFSGPVPLVGQKLAQQQAEKRIDQYLLRHTQQVSSANGQGVIGFARVASFETE